MATTIFGPMDIFNQAGRLWNRVSKSPQTPFFDVTIASADAQPIQCLNKIQIQSHRSMETLEETELIIIASDCGDPLVVKTRRWIEQHCAQAVDYDELAAKFRISRRSFERRFKRATGVTPLGYQQQLRVETAKRLLEEGGRSCNEIRYMVGYEDVPSGAPASARARCQCHPGFSPLFVNPLLPPFSKGGQKGRALFMVSGRPGGR